MLHEKQNSPKGKKVISLVIISLVIVLALVSIWSILPKINSQAKTLANFKNDNSECVAQGHYAPKPLQKTQEYAPATPVENDGKEILLATTSHYRPKPLKPDTTGSNN